MFAEGLVLVSSATERQVQDSGEGGDTPVPPSDVKGASSRKRKDAPKEEAQLSKVLRSVYQSAVKEEIPSEMLDLLRKLD